MSVLAGCNVENKKADSDDLAANFENVQKMEVISPEESDSISTITDNEDIADFTEALKMSEWEMVDVPSDAIMGKQFELYKQETIKFGESSDDKKELKHVASIITYMDTPYVDLQLKTFKLSFKIPEDVHEYLSKYE
ncbi:hypothetical protein [Bacillus andreraoultii]|uniref:hypothetical protein n=1 Tax=Bacillus andreraoultii TaxID=1499685 RepID=UPI0011124948|nr:hypothetical protein [Bacillus andreraoultii]